METVTLADELVLFGYARKSGKLIGLERQLDLGVAAALLIELTLAGQITIGKKRRLRFDAKKTGVSIIDTVVEVWQGSESTALWKFVRDFADKVGHAEVRDRLVAAGLLHERGHRILGVFASPRFPSGQDQEAEFHARQRIEEALASGEAKDLRTALLCRLLGAVELEAAVLPARSLARRQSLRDRLLIMSFAGEDAVEPDQLKTAAEVLRELQRVVGVFHSDLVTDPGLRAGQPDDALEDAAERPG